MTFRHRRFNSAALFLLLFCVPRRSFAHKDDYIDETLVFVTVERGEWELEYWFDLGWISNVDGEMSHQDVTRHNFVDDEILRDLQIDHAIQREVILHEPLRRNESRHRDHIGCVLVVVPLVVFILVAGHWIAENEEVIGLWGRCAKRCRG